MYNTNQQKKNNNTNTGENANKIRLSLVMKLNLRMFLNTLGVLISINIFLCLLFVSVTLWNAEASSVDFIKNQTADNRITSERFFIIDTDQENDKKGINFWNVFHEYTPLKNYAVERRISFDNFFESDLRNISNLKYHIIFIDEGSTVTYELGSALAAYLTILIVVLIFEALLLLFGIPKGARSIRRILRPLTDITQRTQKLTTAPRGTVPAEEMSRLRELAGTISSIDATKLDKRLPVDGTQKELKDLAFAINDMLNRIDEAYRSQVRFVSDASHELRTPISVVQGYANLLDRWGKNDEETMQEAIDAIKSEAEGMKDLIEQLLFLARGDNETLQLYPEIIDCSALVEEILHETQMIDSLHTFRMKVLSPAFINADRQLMKQALRILVENSIKYTPEDGEILVSVSSEKELVRISVQDNGIGIDAQNLPYIFDRFYRSDESRARETGGSGLGLSIMKWIIDRHGGSIEVISRKDIGTRTTIIMEQANVSIDTNNEQVFKTNE